MANMYRSVLSGGGGAAGDAVAADVLSGKTFSNAQATGISGTMVNNGAVSGSATPSQPYTIPAGYHNGSGTVTANAAFSEVLTQIAGATASLIQSDGTITITTDFTNDQSAINTAADYITTSYNSSSITWTYTAKTAGTFKYKTNSDADYTTVTKAIGETITTHAGYAPSAYIEIIAL